MRLKGRPWRIELPSFGECRLPKAHSTQVVVEVVERRVCGCSRQNSSAHCHGRDWKTRRAAAMRPATRSQKLQTILFLAPKRVLSCPPSVGFLMKLAFDESGFLMKLVF